MAAKTVLITGANGHLGFRVLVSALEDGYTVRAVVRRAEAGVQIKAAKSVQPLKKNLEIIVVSDLLKEGALDEAMAGMNYVLHLASPVSRPSEDYYNDFVAPAVQGTMGVLRSAAKNPSVKRVVITSSMAVLNLAKQGPIFAEDIGEVPDAHAAFLNPFMAYTASKKIALNETMKFIKETRPKFDVINILPSVILGRNELAKARSDLFSGTNRYVMNIVLGNDAVAPMLGVTVFVDDCAEVHVKALRPEVAGSQNFIASSGSVVWSDVSKLTQREFGAKVESEGLKLGGKLDTKSLELNVDSTVDAFGVEWKPFEEQVKSVVGQYFSLKQ